MAKITEEQAPVQGEPVFRFECKSNPFLYVPMVGIQFRNGVAETKSVKVAEHLREYDTITEL